MMICGISNTLVEFCLRGTNQKGIKYLFILLSHLQLHPGYSESLLKKGIDVSSEKYICFNGKVLIFQTKDQYLLLGLF